MSSAPIASKNLFDLLGNDVEGDEAPSGPVKTVDKTTMRSTKRNVEPQAPVKSAVNTGARRAGPGGNEGAFRDRNAGAASNHRKSTEEVSRPAPRGGRDARGRGGRGGRFSRDRDDRHTKGAATGSEKQAAQSWGAQEGNAEQKDEQFGEEIAQTELKESTTEDAQDGPVTPAEPEDKHVSYSDYLVQQAEKKLSLGESLEIRKPNEGTKVDKKWANAKALTKEEDENYVSGVGGKVKRERERKAKQLLEIDQRYVEPERTRGGGRGGRGGNRGEGRERGGRGGRGRGEPRGEGRGEPRGEHREPRGEHRSDFRGGRGGARGGARDNAGFALNADAFPSLGA